MSQSKLATCPPWYLTASRRRLHLGYHRRHASSFGGLTLGFACTWPSKAATNTDTSRNIMLMADGRPDNAIVQLQVTCPPSYGTANLRHMYHGYHRRHASVVCCGRLEIVLKFPDFACAWPSQDATNTNTSRNIMLMVGRGPDNTVPSCKSKLHVQHDIKQ